LAGIELARAYAVDVMEPGRRPSFLSSITARETGEIGYSATSAITGGAIDGGGTGETEDRVVDVPDCKTG
jgi:hypothetical protein